MTKSCFNFTKAKIDQLITPSRPYETHHDTVIDGLVLIVYASGSKTFHLYKKTKDGKPIKPKLGKYGEITIEQARKMALKLLSEMAHGHDPQKERNKKKSELTVGEMFNQYIEDYARHHCATWEDLKKNFTRYFGLWDARSLSSLEKKEIVRRLNALNEEVGAATANKSLDTIRAAYNWAIKLGYYTGNNPTEGVTKFHTQARDRFIHPEEFAKFLEALSKCTNVDIRDYVYLSLFTGARQSNVLSMRWDQIDFDLALWRIPKTKNQESHTIPLTVAALAVLENRKNDKEWVFPSKTSSIGHIVEPKVGWQSILNKAELKDLRMHDLRRTLGSYMAMSNQSLHIIGKALGHQSHTSTQIYARLANDPVRSAMEKAQADMFASGSTSVADFTHKIADLTDALDSQSSDG